MENIIQNKCLKYWDNMQMQYRLQHEIELMLKDYVEANRKFANGEIVLVCAKDNHHVFGKGVVTDAKSYIKLDDIDLKHYAKDDKTFNNDIQAIGYEIFALKKDGKISSKHFFQHPNFLTDFQSVKYSDVYIKKLEA